MSEKETKGFYKHERGVRKDIKRALRLTVKEIVGEDFMQEWVKAKESREREERRR